MSEGTRIGIAWRRLSAQRHYVGTLELAGHAIRLRGRDQAGGIEAALTIPFEEVEGVRLSGWDERLAGERGVVLELADAQPIVLRRFGTGDLRTAELLALLRAGAGEDALAAVAS